jgi:alkanesulfonate monooxygenase SsuD/methylene tetrahydromethanopterin reductase-like flavin-dependent oxidoreductase (luciferase family)
MVATLQAISGGRVQLGIGIGGHPAEHRAMGIPFPNAPERVDRLREAIEVLRALWTGDRVTRPSPYYPLEDAYALPRPQPTPPIIIGGETRGGARLAAELGDGWTVGSDKLHDLLPQYLESLQELGKVGQHHAVLVAFQGSEWLRRGESRLTPWCEQPFETLAEWRAFGADGVILTATSDTDITRLVRATDRW